MAVKKTHFSHEELANILSNYDLGTLMSSKLFATGAVQTNIFVQTTKGKFVFRYYEQGRPNGSIMFEVNLLKYLKKRHYPCPMPFKDRHGKFIGMYKFKPFVIFEFLEGEHPEHPTEHQKKQLIKQVAALQNITKNYRPSCKRYRYNYDVDFCRKYAQDQAKKIGTANAQDKLKRYKDQFKKLILPKSLPKGICHCDFHFSNVLFKDGRFNALIDFDDANHTFLVFDLVWLFDPFIPSFNRKTWSKYSKDDAVLDLREVRKIVAEYSRYRPLHAHEKRHLFDVYKLSILIDCLRYFDRGKAEDFYEKRKIEYIDNLGRDKFYHEIFD